ncbi:MAG: penicillin acylase family protein [Candidatus Eisenbacteria bacterium]
MNPRFLTAFITLVLLLPSLLAGGASEARVLLPTLSAPVSLITDLDGIPHVRAGNLRDLYTAWGWVVARDRLWQLVYTRAQADGIVHRWLGNTQLLSDGGAQLFRLHERAIEIWQRDRADTNLAQAIVAYTAGINAYLAGCRSGQQPWPAELQRLNARPRDWRPEDTVALLLGLGITLDLDFSEIGESRAMTDKGADWLTKRRRFESDHFGDTIPDTAAARLYAAWPRAGAVHSAAPAELPGSTLTLDASFHMAFPEHEADGSDRASNAFAVGGGRTESGRPILGNDPHLAFGAPGPFHVIHISVPGVLDAIGADVPGLPAIVSGRNARCAWGVTALSADVLDVYADTLDASGRKVRWQSGWRPIVQKSYDLRYRLLGVAVPVPALAQVRRYTPHGPVLVYDRKKHLALSARWSALEDGRITLRRVVGVERSGSAPEVAERFRTLVTPTINCVAADVDGAVIYQTVGLVPRRPFPFTRGVLPSDGRHEWAGFIAADSMPAWRAPGNTFIVNGNNRPVGTRYPEPFMRYDFDHDRFAQMSQRLAGDARMTLADAASVQNDTYSRAGERSTPALLAALGSLEGLTPRELAALDTLRHWDHMARRGRVAPTLNRAWWNCLQRRSGTEGVPNLTLAGLTGRAPEALRQPGGDRTESPRIAARRALGMALDSLTAQLGPDIRRWTWGRAHGARFRHPLSALDARARWEPGPTPIDGDGSTVSVGGTRMPFSPEVTHGPVYRQVVDLALPDSSWGIVPPWNSAVHRVDLRQRWADHRYVPFLMNWERITARALESVRLEPAPGARR